MKHPRRRRSKGRADPNDVSRETLREVHERDAGQCTFVSADGERCPAREWREVDHRQPRALGGDGTIENVRILLPHAQSTCCGAGLGTEHVARKHRGSATRIVAAAADRSAQPNLVGSRAETAHRPRVRRSGGDASVSAAVESDPAAAEMGIAKLPHDTNAAARTDGAIATDDDRASAPAAADGAAAMATHAHDVDALRQRRGRRHRDEHACPRRGRERRFRDGSGRGGSGSDDGGKADPRRRGSLKLAPAATTSGHRERSCASHSSASGSGTETSALR
ncbi:MAG: hypothetical protein KIT84_44205 [Labilithrix sp.]|nr:hypothetical protein [Labilithrix sp.]